MTSPTFANKLFNRLDNGLFYDEETIYEMKEINVSGIGGNIIFVSVYNDNIYFVSNDKYKEIKQIDINSEDHSYNVIKTVNNNISSSFVTDNNNICYNNYDFPSSSYKGYITTINEGATETEISNIYKFININSNNQILFEYYNANANSVMYISNLNEINEAKNWKQVLTDYDEYSYINNKYYIYRTVDADGKLQVNIKNISTNTITSFNTTEKKSECYCFANDTIFGYLVSSTRKVYILSVAKYEAAQDKSALSFTEVAVLDQNMQHFYITNKWFVYCKDQKIYYCPVEYLYNSDHKITQHMTQMDLLYSINKKLNTLTDLLEQFKVPEN